jgi:hypothetical protein
MGRLIASIGVKDDFGYGVKVLFHRVGSSKSGYITYDYRGAAMADFRHDRSKTKVLSFDLAPGMYEILDIELQTQELATRTYFSVREKLSIPFEVKPGQITYLGELVAEAIFNEGAPEAYSLPDGSLARKGKVVGAFFHVRSELKRDLAAVNAPAQAVDATPTFQQNASPLFQWEPAE